MFISHLPTTTCGIIVWEGLGGLVLLEGVVNWGVGLELSKVHAIALPSYLFASYYLVFVDQM